MCRYRASSRCVIRWWVTGITPSAAFEGAPLQHELRTYFAVFATEESDELEQRADDLLAGAAEIQSDLSDPSAVIRDLSRLLDQAEDLLSGLEAHPDGCPPDDQAFMRVITQVVEDIMNTFLERWDGETPDQFQAHDLQRMVDVGLRAGAIGSGAADPGSAQYLQGKAEELVQRQFDTATDQDPKDRAALTHAAVTATMLGYTFDSGQTGQDVCNSGSC